MSRLPKKHKMPDGTLKTVFEIATELNFHKSIIQKRLKKSNFIITPDVLKPKKTKFFIKDSKGKKYFLQK